MLLLTPVFRQTSVKTRIQSSLERVTGLDTDKAAVITQCILYEKQSNDRESVKL